MQRLLVKPSKLGGELSIPPSKSQTLRAILFATMGKGKSRIGNFLCSPDTDAMIAAARAFGAKIALFDRHLEIEGVAGRLQPASDIIDAKNSGLVLRLMGALAGLLPSYTVITGDESIRRMRPVQPLLTGIEQLGAFAKSSKLDGFAPIIIRGPMKPGRATISGEDSQPVSALLIACSFLEGETKIQVDNPGEKPWIDLTLSWLEKLNIRFARHGHSHFILFGRASYPGFSYTVPADFSSAAYPLVAALVTGSELVLQNLDFEDAQGDKKVISLLQKMGAKIEIEGTKVVVQKSKLKGCKIDVNDFIDAISILTVVGCFAEGTTEICGAKIARHKESDRISAITTELKKMGANIEEKEDGLVIHNSSLNGASLFSHHDHRIALSLAVAALGAKTESMIDATGCIAKTYPTFSHDFLHLGASLLEN